MRIMVLCKCASGAARESSSIPAESLPCSEPGSEPGSQLGARSIECEVCGYVWLPSLAASLPLCLSAVRAIAVWFFDAMMKAAFLLSFFLPHSLPRSLSFLSSSSFGAWASLLDSLVSQGANSLHSSLGCSTNLLHDTYWVPGGEEGKTECFLDAFYRLEENFA